MMKLSLSGIKEVDAKMRTLPLALQHKIMLSVHHEAAKPMVDNIRNNTPVSTKGRMLRGKWITPGGLEKSIGSVSIGTPARTGEIGAVAVGARINSGYKGYHAHLVEFGTKGRKPGGWYAKFKNPHKTIMPAHPFIEPAFERTKAKVAARIAQAVVDKMYSHFRRRGIV